jgi:hypothetical protein
MRVLGFLSALVAAVAGSVGFAAADWQLTRYSDLRFAIEFPGTPTASKMQLSADAWVLGRQYLVGDEGVTKAYLGQGMRYVHEYRAKYSTDRLLRVAIDGARDAGTCALRSERPYAFPGAAAREVIFENCKNLPVFKSRVILLGDWLYFIGVGGPAGTEENANTKRFRDSFSVISN